MLDPLLVPKHFFCGETELCIPGLALGSVVVDSDFSLRGLFDQSLARAKRQ